ncbi:MAG TPA: response regulator [Tepidisphaeraceae bacterium]|jgi:FixJ family two-component response regulator|nr:response regulator [Tepidisphaeraceae bacterium]
MGGPVIFVIDDDASVRRAIRRLVSSLQHTVRLFASAEQFLAHADNGTPGCLILDMRLPGISGLQLQKQLADQKWNLPVIFITAHEDPRSRDAALRAGAMDYLAKPFECEKLLQSVRSALRGQL